MKKLKFLLCVLMAASFAFVSCNKDDEPKGPVTYVEDGFYVVGDATAIADLQSTDASKGLMAAGLDENNGQAVREGMYEKYVALEGGKSFALVLKAGSTETKYGATLTKIQLADAEGNPVNDQPTIEIYKGALTENGTLQVTETGLYHIILDVNLKAIVVAPVEWGVRGAMNSWGFTALEKPAFNKTTMTYTLKNVKVETAGGFKFAYGNGWKIELNTGGDPLVKANTNLGNDATENGLPLTAKVIPGGKDIGIERAIYDIELTWTLAKGAVKDGYSVKLTKVGELGVLDPATFVYSLIGNAVFVDGAQTDWNADLDIAYVSKAGNTYTFEAINAKLGNGEFKVRFSHEWGKSFGLGEQEGNVISLVNNGGNITHEGEVTYSKITFTFDWDGAEEVNPTLTLVP